jgi:hypothetical protein
MEKPEENWHTLGIYQRFVHFDSLNGLLIPITNLPIFLFHLIGWYVDQSRLQSYIGHKVRIFLIKSQSEQDMRAETISP